MEDVHANKDIFIGKQKVSPGEEKQLKINIDRLPTGTLIDIPVYVYNAKEPGPVILVQGGLHGDEINGIEIVRKMIQDQIFKVQKGAIIAVPILNVFGFIHFSRDVPDGKDVNRSFPGSKSGSMASRIAYHHISEIVQQVDFGIDLHTGGAQRHNYPQVRYTLEDEKSKELARVFNAPYVFPSKLIKGSFRNEAFKRNVPTIVFEAGESMRFDDFSILKGMQGILKVLKHLQMITKIAPPFAEKTNSVSLENRKWLRAPTAGMFIPQVLNGAEIEKDQVLGLVTDAMALKNKLIKAPYDGYVIALNFQAVVNQGDALFHIGKKE